MLLSGSRWHRPKAVGEHSARQLHEGEISCLLGQQRNATKSRALVRPKSRPTCQLARDDGITAAHHTAKDLESRAVDGQSSAAKCLQSSDVLSMLQGVSVEASQLTLGSVEMQAQRTEQCR